VSNRVRAFGLLCRRGGSTRWLAASIGPSEPRDGVSRRSLARLRRDRGAAAVEFAIILPILMLVVFGVIQFGIALSRIEVYVSAAREGARYAAVHCRPEAEQCTSDMVQARVVAAAAGYSVATPVVVDRDCSLAASFGEPVVVGWTQPIPISIPFWGSATINTNISGTFRCE
jgi:Flp pilus assembly protein TadG